MLKREFDDGRLDPDQQYNMGESHVLIDLDDGKTLDFRGVAYRSSPSAFINNQLMQEWLKDVRCCGPSGHMGKNLCCGWAMQVGTQILQQKASV
ncbi:hypothetical protein PInf_022691 [Phytophthora infestans]|nr:hypothetical protein PInf_022691 [Phytophthora infestans]